MSPNEAFFSCHILKSREIRVERCVATLAAVLLNEASNVAPRKNALSVMIKGRGKL